MPPLDSELESLVDLVPPHRDIDAVGEPPVQPVEDDALPVPFDVQDRVRFHEVRGANLEPLRNEAAEVSSRRPDARLIACLLPPPDVVGGHLPDEPGDRAFDGPEPVAGGHDLRTGPR